MVTVANAGNAADTNIGSVFGAVAYSYQIGAYDVTGSQYTAFLNAVGKSDTYALYSASIGHRHQWLPKSSARAPAGTYTYAVLNSSRHLRPQ